MLDSATPVTQDAWRASVRARNAFLKVRNAEIHYGAQLRKVARHVGDLVRGLSPHDKTALSREQADVIQRALNRYSEALRPWAKTVGARMLADIALRDERAWIAHAKEMSAGVKQQLRETSIGEVLREYLDDQVRLITSLPTEAGQRVHDLVTGNLYTGERAASVAEEIMNTGLVTRNRANLIAITETGRAASGFMMARAKAVDSEGYIWRTALDYKVRPLHKKLEGTFHRWDQPPVTGPNGERSLPGAIYRCRCIPEPVIPDQYE